MTAKEECEKLMNEMLPLAEKMLAEFGEFIPYGGYMKDDGEIVHVGAKKPETDRPKSNDLIEMLKSSFRNLADSDQCKATAIVFDVVIPLPDQDRKSDAIQIMSRPRSELFSRSVLTVRTDRRTGGLWGNVRARRKI